MLVRFLMNISGRKENKLLISRVTQAQGLARTADIISIQSQVVYGSVGNSIALPALIKHGWHTLAVPTFLLSNTPDNQGCYGGEISDAWFCGFLQSIQERRQDTQLRAVITGYLGSTSKAERVFAWLNQIATQNPGILIVVDPVMGDDDTGYYVDPDLTFWYRNHLLPLATGLTPNRFELECLMGKTLITEQEIISAALTFLNDKTQWVVVTSASHTENSQMLKIICVSASIVHIVEHAALPNAPKGTGDLFTAELTAGLLRGFSLENAVKTASELTRVCVMNSLIDGTDMLDIQRLESGELKC
ncbi:PfkB family carbohydrate kinase [Enterobacter sp. 638]|uniref:PfkB family carbohydrate kinase n=1 Tax=Enterobacter sp. (strain 638) TaxID=399742 RepID=UPI001CC02509|nr:PfkB family carbohydrate kinase [Enterobacter sp. 638]